MIVYNEEFKQKCKDLYPDYEKLHEKIELNQSIVGRYLEDSFGIITWRDILASNDLDELKDKAKLIKAKRELYEEWGEIYSKACEVNR